MTASMVQGAGGAESPARAAHRARRARRGQGEGAAVAPERGGAPDPARQATARQATARQATARYDAAVAGAGLAGLAAALALARAMPGARVALLDPALGRPPPRDERASAVAAGPRRLLEAWGAWGAVAGVAEPVRALRLCDPAPGDPTRLPFLGFGPADWGRGDGAEGDGAPGADGAGPFAHMVPNGALRAALLAACREAGVALVPRAVARFTERGEALALDAGGPLAAALLVAADGARSRLRGLAGVAFHGWDYPQAALVATIAHAAPHEGVAAQHFLPGGPLAMLPLRDAAPGAGPLVGLPHRSSLVWTVGTAEARRLAALPPGGFAAALGEAFGHRLGALALAGPLEARPLRLGLAARLAVGRVALLGDAARVVHPLAGQGLNLGLKDAGALAGAVGAAWRLGLDPGGPAVLAAYERARRLDGVAMALATDALDRLFSTASAPARLLRGAGAALVAGSPVLKRWLVREAAGAAR